MSAFTNEEEMFGSQSRRIDNEIFFIQSLLSQNQSSYNAPFGTVFEALQDRKFAKNNFSTQKAFKCW